MTKQNGHHSGTDIEHGYQDWRDQRDRERGRDDFRGLDRDPRMGPPRHNTGEHGDRYQGGGQFAERDRDMYGDSDRGYGYDDGDRERMSYRGQSGAQAGGHYDNEHMNYQGGNRGHWGDFDRGGQSGGGRDRNYDTQSPRFGRENERDRMRGPHAGKGPQGFQRSDERIKELVHEALTDHEHIDATHVTVDVNNGEVVLAGTVDDRNAKRLAEDIVERINGVKDVQNQLRPSTSTNTSHITSDPKMSKPS